MNEWLGFVLNDLDMNGKIRFDIRPQIWMRGTTKNQELFVIIKQTELWERDEWSLILRYSEIVKYANSYRWWISFWVYLYIYEKCCAQKKKQFNICIKICADIVVRQVDRCIST